MQNVSYFNALDVAYNGTRRILFTPFNLGKWFALGFSAWLAMLGERGGSFGFKHGLGGGDYPKTINDLSAYIQSHLTTILTVGIVTVVAGLAIGFLFMWLSSRGKFMLLDNVAQDRQLVEQPWRLFREHGNSLFLWRLVFVFILLLIALIIVGAGVVVAWPDIQLRHFDHRAVQATVMGSILALLLMMVSCYIQLFLVDFVVPLMWKYNLSATKGWSRFAGLYRAQPGTFILYGLVRLLITIAAGSAIMLAGLLTCCCGFLLLMIPYVNAVCVLPITVFVRLYSLEFLKQFGPEFDVAAAPAQPPALPAA